ncbi:MAG TPA: class I SAM-dependent methyltransferase [Vicinamibacterales bacterium]|nr:class I SAM-dependent methyltransferase [Vicinamibacterales bacterium]
MNHIDLEAERALVNRIGPEYFTHKAMTIDRKQILMMVRRGLPYCRGPRVLEMSYNDRGWTDALLDRGFDLTVIEGARFNVEYARAKYGQRLRIIEVLFEEFEPAERYDSIVMSCIIEHVIDPGLVLRRAASWLNDDGVIVLVVPNKRSLHRRVGLRCGLLESMEQLSEQDLSVGHRRLYTVESLSEEIANAGLRTPRIEGIFLKPLSSAQMMDWPDSLLNAFDDMANELLDYSAYLFAPCYKC